MSLHRAPVAITTAERRAVAALVSSIAARDRVLADHSLACGSLSMVLARTLDLGEAEIATAAIVGTVHEVGTIAVAEDTLVDLTNASAAEFAAVQQQIREATVTLLAANPVLERYAETTGMVYDDAITAPIPRIVVVADVYDALMRRMPGLGDLTQRQTVDVLLALAGPRVDEVVVGALVHCLRRHPYGVMSA